MYVSANIFHPKLEKRAERAGVTETLLFTVGRRCTTFDIKSYHVQRTRIRVSQVGELACSLLIGHSVHVVYFVHLTVTSREATRPLLSYGRRLFFARSVRSGRYVNIARHSPSGTRADNSDSDSLRVINARLALARCISEYRETLNVQLVRSRG